MLPPYLNAKKVNAWRADVASLHAVWAEELQAWADK